MRKHMWIALLAGALMMSGCGDSDPNVISGIQGIVAPLCQDDNYTTNQDTTLTVNATNGVLANDAPNGGTATFQATSTQGGTVTGDSSGAFTYTPPNSFTGVDTFIYTVTNAAGQVTCTVTITVNTIDGFFVDAVNGNDGTGSFTGGMPFQTIQAAVAVAPTNADIVVLPGNYTGGINLKDGQRLLGSGSTLVNPQGATRPQLTGPVDIANGNTLDFLRIEGTSTGDAVNGNGQDSGTITRCEIVNITGGVANSPIELIDIRGVWTVSDNTIDQFQSIGVDVDTSNADQLEIIVSNNQISNGDLSALTFVANGTSQLNASVVGNIFSGNNTVTGNAFELINEGSATFCLDLENNTNDDAYLLSNSDSGSNLNIEEFNTLTDPQPGGAGNSGTLNVDSGPGFSAPTPQVDGFCGF